MSPLNGIAHTVPVGPVTVVTESSGSRSARLHVAGASVFQTTVTEVVVRS